MLKLDSSNPFEERVRQRLEIDEVAWLVSVSPTRVPQASLVWFLWDQDSTVLIYSQDKPKLHNIETHPAVGLHLNSDADGTNMVVFTGVAKIDRSQPAVIGNPTYLAKYRSVMERVGYDIPWFSDSYGTAITIELNTLRGF